MSRKKTKEFSTGDLALSIWIVVGVGFLLHGVYKLGYSDGDFDSVKKCDNKWYDGYNKGYWDAEKGCK